MPRLILGPSVSTRDDGGGDADNEDDEDDVLVNGYASASANE